MKKDKEKLDKSFGFMATESDLECLKFLADSERVPKAEIIRRLIREATARRIENPPAVNLRDLEEKDAIRIASKIKNGHVCCGTDSPKNWF